MADVVVFLQNAWSSFYAGDIWPREYWLPALQRSHSGRRLQVLERGLPGVSIWYDNTTPIVGEEPSSVVPPDLDHMWGVIHDQRPRVIVTCGKQAEKALAKIPLGDIPPPIVNLPHPAWRFLDDLVLENGARQIMDLLVKVAPILPLMAECPEDVFVLDIRTMRENQSQRERK